ncbi:MAG: D-alanine--D-alanine ligase [Bacteroidales bacterium]
MKKNIAIIAGGDSGEYGISVKSGSVVAESFDQDKFNTYLISIRGAGWFLEKGDQKIPVDKNDFSVEVAGEKIRFDCVFCAIHGTPGENGKMPAYFEMLGIPYTSTDSTVSALTFNKELCNRVVSTYDIPLAGSMHFYREDHVDESEILEKLSLPLFVKPNSGGSSVGMTKVKEPGQLQEAIQSAFREDSEVLIEEYIKGRELTCGLIGYKGRMYVFPICEIVSKKEFFDFEAKYNPNLADEIVPADIPEELEIQIKETSAFLYKKLNCRGVVRVDYIHHTDDDILYFLEMNTVPGLTRESIVPKMAREMGISLQELFTMMVEDAIWRRERLG